MLSGQIKAFGVGVLLCRNDLYKNVIRYTLLWPLSNFTKYAELHSTLEALADFQGRASSAEDRLVCWLLENKNFWIARTVELKKCISSYGKISSYSNYKTCLFLHICVWDFLCFSCLDISNSRSTLNALMLDGCLEWEWVLPEYNLRGAGQCHSTAAGFLMRRKPSEESSFSHVE